MTEPISLETLRHNRDAALARAGALAEHYLVRMPFENAELTSSADNYAEARSFVEDIVEAAVYATLVKIAETAPAERKDAMAAALEKGATALEKVGRKLHESLERIARNL